MRRVQLLQDGVIAALAAVGLTTLVWLTVTALRFPRRGRAADALAVVPVRGAAAQLEFTVRALERTRYDAGAFSRIVLVDCGADADALAVAARLCAEDYDVTICRPEGLYQLI